MAKPPEPIEEVLPQAVMIVDAEVAEVLKTGPQPPKKEAPPHATSVGRKVASQTVKLKVKRVIKGDKVTELVVEKPEAGYSLRAGNHGPFLIDSSKTILGRYGPDSWSFDRIEKALKG
ncbi:MAG: hypothetical protein HY906_13470 [Deltaproteobacteria bacterium]|nr:hypothetical protein [Deltaproteobacteria bacterium]